MNDFIFLLYIIKCKNIKKKYIYKQLNKINIIILSLKLFSF